MSGFRGFKYVRPAEYKCRIKPPEIKIRKSEYVQVKLNDDLHLRLKNASRELRCTMSELVEDALEQYIIYAEEHIYFLNQKKVVHAPPTPQK